MTIHQINPAISPLFLSCVTKEFRPYRDALAKDLSLPHVKVQVQEDFIEGGHSLLEKLDEYIKKCVAVIHLIGSATGSTPKPAEVTALLKNHADFTQHLPFLKGCLTELSYTQWEVWLSIYHEVPCYVYRAEPSIMSAPGFVETPDEQRLQEEHWKRIQEYGKDWRTFPNEFDLRILVLRSLNRILPRGEIKSHVIPKGLRSFDGTDTAFFLDLLPGLHDENNLPLSIRFWKHAIEERRESTFSIGVIYGPSGCGKSSLVKAGLLPRLAHHVICLYVEATTDGTESRLLNGLRKRFPELNGDLNLTDSLNEIRSQRTSSESKAVLVIDQFEQWLHGKRISQMTELIEALRRSDGKHLQTLLIVRGDFWEDLSRFIGELNVRLIQDQNTFFVDLFDQIHAENVLTAFGRGYGRLGDQLTLEQKNFVKEAVVELSEEGRVISVRLALFAEMVKGRPWIPTTLKEIGGIEGVGFAFLEETFSSSKADPKYRRHETAVRNVLKALMPETGTDLKGNMKSFADLFVASEYARRPADFDELLRILDIELHLITPTNPENQEGLLNGDSAASAESKFYQLTHDYLVPSLRDWLTRKQKETRKGRAELLLADRAVVWNARPENRQLPSLWQWIQIHWLTQKKSWMPPQRKMMRAAGRHHAMRGMAVGLLLAVTAFAGLVIREQVNQREMVTRSSGLVEAVLKAETTQVPEIIRNMADYRKWADPLLRDDFDKAVANSPQKLHASLALLPVDSGQVDYLYGRLLDAKPNEVPVIIVALLPHKDTLLDKLWAVVASPEKGKESQRLRAASALAKYVPDAKQWDSAAALVVNDLVLENPVFLGEWSEAFRPVKKKLLSRLSEVFRESQPERTAERNLATNLLAEYADDDVAVLADLLMDADEKQFAIIFPKLRGRGEESLPILTAEIDQQPPTDWPSFDDRREKLAKRQANAAATLLRLNQPATVWKLLAFHPKNDDPNTADPRVRSYLVDRLAPLEVDPQAIIKQLDDEPDITIRRALLLSLGEFSEQALSLDDRKKLFPKLQEMYQTNADPGLHAASEWLLRQWKHDDWLKGVNEKWANDKEWRSHHLEGIRQSLMKEKEQASPQWYINSQGQTLLVIPGPMEFTMGSPSSRDDFRRDELPHHRRISRTIAIAAHPTTVRDILKAGTYKYAKQYAPDLSCPIIGLTWYQAASYCNWLSEKELLEKCFEEDEDGNLIKMKNNYLSLNGYRLPTEAEWEYCCRAGTLTDRYYGNSDELLEKYGWYAQNSNGRSWPVGRLKPNDLGLFDMHGNVWCWCLEQPKNYPQTKDWQVAYDYEQSLTAQGHEGRVLRGGSFMKPAWDVRSACRNALGSSDHSDDVSFRLVRTLASFPRESSMLPSERDANKESEK